MLRSPSVVKKKDVKLNASEVRTLENKWVRLIFNKSQILRTFAKTKTVLTLCQCSKEVSALSDRSFSMESAWDK